MLYEVITVITAPLKVGQEIKGVIGAVIDLSAFTHLFFSDLVQEKRLCCFEF